MQGGRLFPRSPRQKVAATGNRADISDMGSMEGFSVARGKARCSAVWLESIVRKWVPFPMSGASSPFLRGRVCSEGQRGYLGGDPAREMQGQGRGSTPAGGLWRSEAALCGPPGRQPSPGQSRPLPESFGVTSEVRGCPCRCRCAPHGCLSAGLATWCLLAVMVELGRTQGKGRGTEETAGLLSRSGLSVGAAG